MKLTPEGKKYFGEKHDHLIELLHKVEGNKNRRRILEKIALIEMLLIRSQD